jgi:hypothetical protein
MAPIDPEVRAKDAGHLHHDKFFNIFNSFFISHHAHTAQKRTATQDNCSRKTGMKGGYFVILAQHYGGVQLDMRHTGTTINALEKRHGMPIRG